MENSQKRRFSNEVRWRSGLLPDLFGQVAHFVFHLAKDHSFADGNKRTAHVCHRVFLALNDAELQAGGEEKYLSMLALAEGSLDEASFAEWLRPRIVVAHGGKVQEKRAGYRR